MDGARISRVSLSEKNVPLVTLSNSVTYAFHEKLKAWAKVADLSFQNRSKFRDYDWASADGSGW